MSRTTPDPSNPAPIPTPVPAPRPATPAPDPVPSPDPATRPPPDPGPDREPQPVPDPAPTPDPAGSPPLGDLWSRLTALANVVAPTTVVTALLFYFGYVATNARFRSFGVSLDLVDLSLQDLLLYGVEALVPPLIFIALASLLVVAARTGLRWLMAAPRRDAISGWTGVLMALAGLLALLRGVMGLLVPGVARNEAIATTPASLAGGAVLLACGLHVLRVVAVRWDRARPAAEGTRPGELADWLESPALARTLRYGLAWVAVLLVAGAFWAVNSFAASYGRARALDDAAALPDRPAVVLYTKEPLNDLPPGVRQSVLPGADGKAAFRYRCTGLRLLVESGSRLFLVPADWDPDTARTLVVPYDDTVRMQVQPPPQVR
ncbi:hypothetical protein OG828_36970 [Streptomyces sp. NBC_00457]|uniref:hypothetical protein n=1 Tax=Streptomyces sp. NBC_00457 TaxID=2975748 RepID=UPI002E1B9842